MQGSISHILRSIGAGMLVLLPVLVTVAIVAWFARLIQAYSGPDSTIGRILSSIGLVLVTNEIIAYVLGTVIVLTVIYGLGRLAASRVHDQLKSIFDGLFGRLPVVGNLYNLTSRFVGLLDNRSQTDLESMRPVWCFFGGEPGAAVLALMPTAEPITISGRIHRVILVPSAPVPFGGGLIFVPEDWVKPAGFGIEGLTSIYVSMGVTTTQFVAERPDN